MKSLTIVGAGISGLYLAYLLEDKFDITLLEARERAGGRIFAQEGHDMGPSWVWQHQKSILRLLESLELKIFEQYTNGFALYDTKEKLERFHPQLSTPSARVEGSLSALINALQKKLKSTKIIYSEVVKSINANKTSLLIQTQSRSYESDFALFTLPPRLAAKIDFSPKLPTSLLSKMKQTQTWMGNSAKCVVEFKSAFWREKNLSGFAFSHIGPLGEIHDACTKDKAALFGFVNSRVDMQNFQADVRAQMKRVFGLCESEIVKVYLLDWKREEFTSAKEDTQALSAHPEYGIDTTSYDKRVLFSSTEFSFSDGGYIEGAIVRAEKIAKQLLE